MCCCAREAKKDEKNNEKITPKQEPKQEANQVTKQEKEQKTTTTKPSNSLTHPSNTFVRAKSLGTTPINSNPMKSIPNQRRGSH